MKRKNIDDIKISMDDLDLDDIKIDINGPHIDDDLESALEHLPDEQFSRSAKRTPRKKNNVRRPVDETIYITEEITGEITEPIRNPEKRIKPESNRYDNNKSKEKRNKGNKHMSSKKAPMTFKLQVLASLIFFASVLLLNVFPNIYVLVIVLILFLLGALVYSKVRPRHHRRRRTGWKAFSLILSILLIIGSFYMFKSWMVLGDITKDNADVDINLTQDSYIMYISGIDVFGEISQESRSDVNMLLVMNPKTHEILMVNTPRDYYVELTGVSDGAKDKLTHAGIYGVGTSMATLSTLYNTPVEFSTRLNFTSMIDIIDALGGVTVESDIAFTTGENAGEIVDIQEGKNHLTGSQALAFSRERDNLEDGDNQRGINQQAVIKAMLKKAASPLFLVGGNKILDTVGTNVEINMSRKQLQQLIKGYLGGIGRWNITSVQATGTGSTEYCYSYSDGPLYVTIPDASVGDISNQIGATRNGQ
ncbi:MAG: LCP family protein [Suipraeoptans sp.]